MRYERLTAPSFLVVGVTFLTLPALAHVEGDQRARDGDQDIETGHGHFTGDYHGTGEDLSGIMITLNSMAARH